MLACVYRSLEIVCAEQCIWECVCMIPTWSIQEIFDLEAEQRWRDACFIVHLSCYCLQPKHIVVQRLWQGLSWVWMKDEWIKDKKRKWHVTCVTLSFYIYLSVSLPLWV